MRTQSSSIGELGVSPLNLQVGGAPPYNAHIRGTPGLVNYWRLDEEMGAATELSDQVGSLPGTIVGAPSSSSLPYLAEGAITFEPGSYMSVPGTLNVGYGAYEFWVKIDANPATGAQKAFLFGLIESSTKYSRTVHLTSAGSLVITTGTPGGASSVTVPNFPIGRWNHIFVGHNSSGADNLAVYLNGIAAGVATVTVPRTDLAAGSTYLGGTGAAHGFIDCPGSYSDLAIYSGNTTPAYLPARRYESGASSFPATTVRLSQATVQVLRDASNRRVRLSQATVQVLRSVATGAPIDVDASSSISILGEAAEVRDASILGASEFVFADSGDGFISLDRPVEAEDGFTLDGTADVIKIVASSAETAITFDAESRAVFAYDVLAASAFAIGGSGASGKDLPKSALTHFLLADEVGVRRAYAAVAEGWFTLSDQADQDTLFAITASAETGFLLDSGSESIPDTLKLVAAESGLVLLDEGHGGIERVGIARTRFLIGMNAYRRISPARVDGGDDARLTFSDIATATTRGPRPAAASTRILVRAAGDTKRIYTPDAAGSVRLASLAAERRDAAARGSSMVAVGHVARSDRSISVSAVTSMALVPNPAPRNFRYAAEAAGGLLLGQIADVGVGYTGCGSAFTLTDMAIGSVLLPWRFRPLTLPPGGGLPHS